MPHYPSCSHARIVWTIKIATKSCGNFPGCGCETRLAGYVKPAPHDCLPGSAASLRTEAHRHARTHNRGPVRSGVLLVALARAATKTSHFSSAWSSICNPGQHETICQVDNCGAKPGGGVSTASAGAFIDRHLRSVGLICEKAQARRGFHRALGAGRWAPSAEVHVKELKVDSYSTCS